MTPQNTSVKDVTGEENTCIYKFEKMQTGGSTQCILVHVGTVLSFLHHYRTVWGSLQLT